MKIHTIHSKTIPDNKLVVAFDVGKDKLDAYCEYDRHCFQDTFTNNTLKIEQKLITFSGIAESSGYDGLRIIAELFCDYSFNNEYLYTNVGRIFMAKYHANPYRIVQRGYAAFYQRMKKAASRIRKTTLQRLWRDAQASVRHQLPADYVQVLESRLNYLWEELILRENRMAEIEDAVISVTNELRLKDPNIPTPVKGVVTAFRIAQILAETGPLSDFDSLEQLMRYAGLNIRERKSGYYRGNNKISKKGRSNLRRILGYIVLPLVKKKSLYGTVYHAKKDTGMAGNKAMVAMMRKFPKMFYGWYKSGLPFNENRVFTDEVHCVQITQ